MKPFLKHLLRAVFGYPPPSDVVNVANMRHLWIVEKPQFAWSALKSETDETAREKGAAQS